MLFISREDKFDKAIFTLQGLSAERTDGLKGITSMRNGQLLPKPASKEEKKNIILLSILPHERDTLMLSVKS